jgi:hypothetical protein
MSITPNCFAFTLLIAPTAAAGLQSLGSWRPIYVAQFIIGLVAVMALKLGFRESAQPANRLPPGTITQQAGRATPDITT